MVSNCSHVFTDIAEITCTNLGLLPDSFAQMPIPYIVNNQLKVIFTSRNDQGQSIPYLSSLSTENLNVLHDAIKLPIPLGAPGAFDDSGVMPSSLSFVNNEMRIYYIGWSTGVKTPYRLGIGMAVANIDGTNVRKKFLGPIIDRSIENPYFVTTPHVIQVENTHRMYLSSGTSWVTHEGRMESVYGVRTCESEDGINWTKFNSPPLDRAEGECVARPVALNSHIYSSKRQAIGFRETGNGYRIEVQREVSTDKYQKCETSWESDEEKSVDRAYGIPISIGDSTLFLYNGDRFGRTGFRIATEVITQDS